jgi:predicted dehydrogenase
LVEKPFATSSDQHDWILRHAAESGVQVGVGFQRRLYGGTMLAQQIVAKALFGPIKQIWATEGMRLGGLRPGGAPWSTDRKMAGGGVLTETACHIIDQLFTICASTDWQLGRCELCYLRNVDFEASVAGTLVLGNGQRCKFGIAVSWLEDLYNAIMIEFAAAQLKISIWDAGLQIADTHGNSIARVEDLVSSSGGGGAFESYYDEWREFIGQTISRQPSRLTADTARSTTKFIEECYRQQPPPVMD